MYDQPTSTHPSQSHGRRVEASHTSTMHAFVAARPTIVSAKTSLSSTDALKRASASAQVRERRRAIARDRHRERYDWRDTITRVTLDD